MVRSLKSANSGRGDQLKEEAYALAHTLRTKQGRLQVG